MNHAARTAWVKEHSGLPWDVLAKMFGTSKRAVHGWANGLRANATQERDVASFAEVVHAVEESLDRPTPAAVRDALHAPGLDGRSVVDRMRRDRTSGPSWGAPFRPWELVGGLG